MPINVSEALDMDTSEIINVERFAAGAHIDGIYVEGTPTKFRTLASSQQPTPAQLQTLKEGDRNSNPRLFISKKPLRVLDDRLGTTADIITFKGVRYRIVALGDWSSYGHTFAFGIQVQ